MGVSGIWFAIASMALSMSIPACVQSSQQLWSLTMRCTKRERQVVVAAALGVAGVIVQAATGGLAVGSPASASTIFGCAAVYARLMSALAKYGCCGEPAVSEWQREHH